MRSKYIFVTNKAFSGLEKIVSKEFETLKKEVPSERLTEVMHLNYSFYISARSYLNFNLMVEKSLARYSKFLKASK